jgi:hypothetical protein
VDPRAGPGGGREGGGPGFPEQVQGIPGPAPGREQDKVLRCALKLMAAGFSSAPATTFPEQALQTKPCSCKLCPSAYGFSILQFEHVKVKGIPSSSATAVPGVACTPQGEPFLRYKGLGLNFAEALGINEPGNVSRLGLARVRGQGYDSPHKPKKQSPPWQRMFSPLPSCGGS